MAQKDPETGPSLELPSLFGRRKRRAEEPGDTTTTDPAPERAPDRAPDPAPAPEAAPVTAEDSEAAERTAVIPVVEEPVVDEPAVDEPVVEKPVVEEPVLEKPVAAPLAAPAAPAATPTPVPTPPPPGPDDPPTEVVPPAAVTSDATPAKTSSGGRRRAERTGPSVPEMAASTAAFLVGAAIGLLGCLLTFVGLQGCELVTGTNSCGGPGLLVLLVILVIMVIAGGVALKRLGVPEAGNVSFLGVGVTTVVALLFLIDFLYDPWMFLVVPVVTAFGYLLAQWVTTMYADDVMGDQDDDGRPHVDIR